MKLIIAEKPSLGRTIAGAVGANKRTGGNEKGTGYLEGNDYIVSWAFGHLYELVDVEKYIPEDKVVYNKNGNPNWRDSMKYLPYFPENWNFKYARKNDRGTKEQIKILRELMNRDDVTAIYSAGDADREGEVIIRLILEANLKKNKELLRLWLPSLTDETIKQAVKDAKSLYEYEGIYQAGRARAAVDWMIGIELTRYATVKGGKLIRIGRCICPIVEKIVERENEIENFVSEKYFAVSGTAEKDGRQLKLTAKKQFDGDKIDEAKAYAQVLSNTRTIVDDVEKKEVTVKAGKLFSLSALQSYISKKDKNMTPTAVLETVQSLYENGYVTYPRTNSSYLAEDETENIEKVLSALKKEGYENIKNKPGNKNIYDSSKVESHSALTPTVKIPKDLSGNKKLVYECIRDRFLAVFCSEPCVVERTSFMISCGDETFKPKGDVLIKKGWKQYENVTSKDAELPLLVKGEILSVQYNPEEKETVPPKRFTVATLNSWMVAPFKKDDVEGQDLSADEIKDILEDATICTEATRAGIIDNGIKSQYIALKDGVYYALDGGKYLVDVMNDLEINLNAKATVELSRDIHNIANGKKTTNDLYKETKKMIEDIYNNNKEVTHLHSNNEGKEPVGICPKCGGYIYETKKAWSCENRTDCGFAIWKDNNFFNAIGFNPTTSRIKTILDDGKIFAKGLTSKKGSKYDAYIVLDGVNGKYPKWSIEFKNDKD